MVTASSILQRYARDPFESARHILRSFSTDPTELRKAAEAWCQSAGPALLTAEGSSWADVHTLLREGSRDSPVFAALVELARCEETTYDGRPLTSYKDDLLRALAYAWPQRRSGTDITGSLVAWVHARRSDWKTRFCEHPAESVALALRAYPEVAYALLDADPCRVDGCPGGRAYPIYLAIKRARDRLEPSDRDRREIAGISGDLCLSNNAVFHVVRQELQKAGVQPPSTIWPEIERALEGPRDALPWFHALALLCADKAHHERAISVLEQALEQSRNPDHLFSVAASPPRVGSGLFCGAGWGRERLATKVLPIARVLVKRRVWPAKAWTDSFTPALDEEIVDRREAQERAHERVREVLAEALLDRALDEHELLATRHAALDAIEQLQPGGDGGIARAMGKLKATELATHAKQVQRILRDTRTGRIDAELAILEAWDAFVAKAPRQEGGM